MRPPTDFPVLLERLKKVAVLSDDPRLKALLQNYQENPEFICRKLGVICDTDVDRIFKTKKTKGQANR